MHVFWSGNFCEKSHFVNLRRQLTICPKIHLTILCVTSSPPSLYSQLSSSYKGTVKVIAVIQLQRYRGTLHWFKGKSWRWEISPPKSIIDGPFHFPGRHRVQQWEEKQQQFGNNFLCSIPSFTFNGMETILFTQKHYIFGSMEDFSNTNKHFQRLQMKNIVLDN